MVSTYRWLIDRMPPMVFQLTVAMWGIAYPLLFFGNDCQWLRAQCALFWYVYITGLGGQIVVVPMYTALLRTPACWTSAHKQWYSLALLGQWAWWVATVHIAAQSLRWGDDNPAWQPTPTQFAPGFIVLCGGSLLFHTLNVVGHLFDGIASRTRRVPGGVGAHAT